MLFRYYLLDQTAVITGTGVTVTNNFLSTPFPKTSSRASIKKPLQTPVASGCPQQLPYLLIRHDFFPGAASGESRPDYNPGQLLSPLPK